MAKRVVFMYFHTDASTININKKLTEISKSLEDICDPKSIEWTVTAHNGKK